MRVKGIEIREKWFFFLSLFLFDICVSPCERLGIIGEINLVGGFVVCFVEFSSGHVLSYYIFVIV